MTIHDENKLSLEFREIADLCEKGSVTLGGMLVHLERRGHALMILFLSGPFLLPVPLPGLSIPFGVLIILFAAAMVMRSTQPLLPKAWLAREIPRETLIKFCRIAYRFFVRFERFFRPRVLFLVESRAASVTIALMILICGVLLALPLPPGTNAPPSSVIVCLSIAFLEKDGLLALLGFVLFVLNAAFFALLGTLGYEGVMKLLSFMSS